MIRPRTLLDLQPPRTPNLAEALDYATIWFHSLGHPIHLTGSIAKPSDLTRTVLFRFLTPDGLPDSAPQRMTIWQEIDCASGAISLYGEW